MWQQSPPPRPQHRVPCGCLGPPRGPLELPHPPQAGGTQSPSLLSRCFLSSALGARAAAGAALTQGDGCYPCHLHWDSHSRRGDTVQAPPAAWQAGGSEVRRKPRPHRCLSSCPPGSPFREMMSHLLRTPFPGCCVDSPGGTVIDFWARGPGYRQLGWGAAGDSAFPGSFATVFIFFN